MNYCSSVSRPDITYSVSVLSRYNQKPLDKHWNAAKRILRYLKGTIEVGIVFHKEGDVKIDCFSDADWAGNTVNRRSTSAVLIAINGAPVLHKSKQQQLVALSTCEAEYVASSLAARDIVWINRLFSELGVDKTSTTLYMDNQSAIRLIKNPEFHGRTKHFDIRVHYIRDQFNNREFSLEYINTQEQRADILTKSLSPKVHTQMVAKMGLNNAVSKLVSLLIFFFCLQHVASQSKFSIEDTIVWRKTDIKHIRGQVSMELDLVFHNPCYSFFNNLTSVPKIDKVLTRTCVKRFNATVLNSLKNLCEVNKNRIERDAGATAVVAAVSAIFATAYSRIRENQIDQELRSLKSLTMELDRQVELQRDSIIVSNERMTSRINSLEKDVDLLAATINAQPEINDAYTQVTIRFDEVKLRLKNIKRALKIGSKVPYDLLDLFNISDLATPDTLEHSTVHTCRTISTIEIKLNIALLKISENIEILKADPFTYWTVDNNLMCKMVYVGQDYILYNHTSNCARFLIEGEVTDSVVLGDGCSSRRAVSKNKTYEMQTCQKVSRNNVASPPVQIKHHGQKVYINCQGHYITIDGERKECPNNIFTINEEKTFIIDDYHYVHESSNIIRPTIDYSVPTKINLLLGTANTEFKSLTAEEISKLQDEANSEIRRTLTEELTNDSVDIVTISSTIHKGVDFIGEYLAILIAFFLLYICLKSRVMRGTTTTISLLMVCPLISAHVHVLEIRPTREQATIDIHNHQTYIKNNWCQEWRYTEEWTEYQHTRGYYPHTLACLLAYKDFSCPCMPSAEWVPVVNHDQVDGLEKYTTTACPAETINLDRNQEEQVDLLNVFSQHLFERAKGDNWPKDKLTRLVASGCLLARKMFNCACTTQSAHKFVIFDKLTRQVTIDMMNSLDQNAANCQATSGNRNRSSVYESYSDARARRAIIHQSRQ